MVACRGLLVCDNYAYMYVYYITALEASQCIHICILYKIKCFSSVVTSMTILRVIPSALIKGLILLRSYLLSDCRRYNIS